MIDARSRVVAIALCAVLCLGACRPDQVSTWEQHAYLWLRSDAGRPVSVPPDISALRVLVAQWSADAGTPWMLESALPEALYGSGSMIAVVRLDGTAIAVPAATAARSLRQALDQWHAGWTPQAIEIDHDSATARLGDYARWLHEFRKAWGAQTPLWITALPDWRRSPALSGLLGAVDVYTLQIHALEADSDELIDSNNALAWIAQFDARSATPYYIALPTYTLRVGRSADGRVRFVESASRAGAAAAVEQTLSVDPTELAALAAILRTTRSSKRRGIAWFRLPSADDRSTLSAQTFSALVGGAPLERVVEPGLVPVQSGAMSFDLSLRNSGAHDSGLPRSIVLGSGCEAGDSAAGYRATADRTQLERSSQQLLRSGQSRTLGWIRCSSATPPLPTVQW